MNRENLETPENTPCTSFPTVAIFLSLNQSWYYYTLLYVPRHPRDGHVKFDCSEDFTSLLLLFSIRTVVSTGEQNTELDSTCLVCTS